MCCGSNVLSTESPEYTKKYKPESNTGCCRGNSNDCDSPSKAREGTPLWEWEQTHGRVIGVFTEEIAPDGRVRVVYSKSTCPKTKEKKKKGCCSLRYSVIR